MLTTRAFEIDAWEASKLAKIDKANLLGGVPRVQCWRVNYIDNGYLQRGNDGGLDLPK
jgi:hypothetical protein